MKRKYLRILILCLIITIVVVGCGKKKKTTQNETPEPVKKLETVTGTTPVNEAVPLLPDVQKQFLGTWVDTDNENCTITISEQDNLYAIDIKLVENVEEAYHWFLTGEYDANIESILYVGGYSEILSCDDKETEENVVSSAEQGSFYIDEDGYLRWLNEKEMIGNDFFFIDINVAARNGNYVIEPMPALLGEVSDALPDAVYPVAFKKENLINNKLTVLVYDYDMYDPSDVYSMAEGTIIRSKGNEITINSISKDTAGDTVKINGGYEARGISLMPDENGYFYRTYADYDLPDYYALGEAVVTLSDKIEINDLRVAGWSETNQIKGTIPSGITSSTGEWNAINTTLKIENGIGVELIRDAFDN